ncbi:WD40/YVTN/BNR-like repeat-containing protein [Pirellulaceae bacterium SH501]
MKTLLSIQSIVVLLLTSGTQTFAQEARETTPRILSEAWLGSWEGEVKSVNATGQQNTFRMRLDIAEHPDARRLKWKITYDGDQGKSIRDYELIAEDLSGGRFVIDEKNGIKIATSRLGETLISHFTIAGQTLVTQYELSSDESNTIDFTIIGSPSDPVTTAQIADQQFKTYLPSSRQFAKLKRTSKSIEGESKATPSPIAWEKLNTDPYRGKQDDIYFINEKVGWYANGAGKIYKSTDGGNTWVLQLEQPGTYFRCLAFLDEKQGFAGNIGPGYFPNVTDSCPLYRTKDGGASWEKVTNIDGAPVVGLCALQILREDFINAGKLDTHTRLIGVGRVGGPTSLIMSDDLGESWQQIKLDDTAAMAFDVHFFNRREGFLAASTDTDVSKSHALILKTSDGGASWRRVYESKRPFELTWKISFPSKETGYVTIQSYNPDPKVAERYVAKSEDGGETWTELPLVTNAAVREFGIAFQNNLIGWIGAVPHGFYTEDGGKSWTKADIGNAVNKIRIVRGDGKIIGFAIGSEVRRLVLPN